MLGRSVLLLAGLLVGGAVCTTIFRAGGTTEVNQNLDATTEDGQSGSGEISAKSACLEHGFTSNAMALNSGVSCRVQCIEGLHYALVAMPDGSKCGFGLMYRNRVCRKGQCVQGLFGDFFPFKNEV